jgi:hypothetical protein
MKLRLPAKYRQIVDELGAVEAKLTECAAEAKPFADREKELRAQVLAWCAELPADKEIGIEGERWALAISARRMERKIVSMAKLFKRLGPAIFFRVCRVALKDVDEHLAPARQKGLISEDQTGPRVITSSPRLAAAKKAA